MGAPSIFNEKNVKLLELAPGNRDLVRAASGLNTLLDMALAISSSLDLFAQHLVFLQHNLGLLSRHLSGERRHGRGNGAVRCTDPVGILQPQDGKLLVRTFDDPRSLTLQ